LEEYEEKKERIYIKIVPRSSTGSSVLLSARAIREKAICVR
ncbi:hypothetical protein T4D_6367, partial [Trichinella pseudospiralis]